MLRLVTKMDQKNKPLELEAEGHTFGYLHYGEFGLVNILAWMPIAEFVLIFLFGFMGYFGITIIRSNEQSLLWVGLAKETAHQLGTPLSSLMAWVEYLKAQNKDTEYLGEIEKDIG